MENEMKNKIRDTKQSNAMLSERISIGKGAEIRFQVYLNKQNKIVSADIREYYRLDGKMLPTKKGIRINRKFFSAFNQALIKLADSLNSDDVI
jgi:Transcriptional Coactivator p15 (PC4)